MSEDAIFEFLIKKLEPRILRELLNIMKSSLIPAIEKNLMRVYDSELSAMEPGYDPAKPSVARAAFRDSIRSSLEQTLEKKSNTVSLSTGNVQDLNLDKANKGYLYSIPKNPGPLSWLVFYLEGFIGEYAFITQEVYKKLADAGQVNKANLDSFSRWGWYGKGFLIPKGAYLDRGFHNTVPFEAVRHPFSGVKPTKLFERAMDSIDFNALVSKAIKKALK